MGGCWWQRVHFLMMMMARSPTPAQCVHSLFTLTTLFHREEDRSSCRSASPSGLGFSVFGVLETLALQLASAENVFPRDSQGLSH